MFPLIKRRSRTESYMLTQRVIIITHGGDTIRRQNAVTGVAGWVSDDGFLTPSIIMLIKLPNSA